MIRLRKKQPASILDAPLLRLSKDDTWTVADACEGTQVFGATGSGKTSGSGQAIAKAMLSRGFGGLVLTAKPDETDLWRRYAEETGRSQSLIVFGSDGDHRFNFLDYEARRCGGTGLTGNIVDLFATVIESVEGGDGTSGPADPFWARALRTLLRNAIDLLILAKERVSLPAIAQVIASAPRDHDQVADPVWRQHADCWRLLQAADERNLPFQEAWDLKVTAAYWCEEFPGLAERTRSSVVATFTTMADGLMRGTLRELFCTDTTVVPEVTHEGAILIIDLPIKRYHELGRAAQIIWKYCWQRATEDHGLGVDPRPVFLWADEAQFFVTARDLDFQTTARSSRACTVYLTQNLPCYQSEMPGGQANVDALMGVLQTKFFHANGDPVTNEWAERTFARGDTARATANTQDRDVQDHRGKPTTKRSTNVSVSTSLESDVPAQAMTMLRKGGVDNGCLVDAIVFQGGRRWKSTGRNVLRTTFDQRS